MHNRGKNFPSLSCSTPGARNPWPLTYHLYRAIALLVKRRKRLIKGMSRGYEDSYEGLLVRHEKLQERMISW
jgi:predicted transcriptional regulator